MLILTDRQHEQLWEIVISILPEKVSDDPDLHYLAHKIARASELEQPFTLSDWLTKIGRGLFGPFRKEKT